MRQQETGFAENRKSLQELGSTINRIDKDVALVQQNMGDLRELPSRVAQLEGSRSVHARDLTELDRRVSANTGHISDLLTDTNRRKGWETPFGRVAGYIAAAVIAGVVAFIAGRGVNTNPQPQRAPSYQPQ